MPSNLFGIALVTVDGQVYTIGDVDQLVLDPVDLQGLHLAEVMQESGEQAIEDSVGVDATGQVFNSIVAVEQYKGHEMNPLRQSRRHRHHQHGEGRLRREAIWNKIIGIHSAFAGRHARR